MTEPTSGATRTETDSMGPIEVPADRYWGAQTQRCLDNFKIGSQRMPFALIRALALVKKAAAQVLIEDGKLSLEVGHEEIKPAVVVEVPVAGIAVPVPVRVRAIVTDVPQPVAVLVLLTRVRAFGAVVAGVANGVVISVRLIDVGHARAIVRRAGIGGEAGIAESISVRVGLRGAAAADAGINLVRVVGAAVVAVERAVTVRVDVGHATAAGSGVGLVRIVGAVVVAVGGAVPVGVVAVGGQGLHQLAGLGGEQVLVGGQTEVWLPDSWSPDMKTLSMSRRRSPSPSMVLPPTVSSRGSER